MKCKNKLRILGPLSIVLVLLISIIIGCIDTSNKDNLEFQSNNESILSGFYFEENTTYYSYNDSLFGVIETRWIDNTSLIIRARTSVNCAKHIGYAFALLLDNGTLNLQYEEIGNEGLGAHCFDVFDLYFTIKEIPYGEYNITITTIERLI